MKTLENWKRKAGKQNSGGFSLVEVLVCIAILAIISVPILAGFRTSMYYTNRAHKTQTATAYAQSVLETVKSTEVKEFVQQIENATDADGNQTGSVEESVDTSLQAEFNSDTAYTDEFFKTIRCKQKDIDIGGKLYDMEVVFNPTGYSQKKDDPAFSNTAANDANVYAVSSVDDVNGMLFPVIADEINQYEGTGSEPSAALYNLREQLKKDQYVDGAPNSTEVIAQLLTIYNNLTKQVVVTIDGGTSGITKNRGSDSYYQDRIRVSCDVIYESEYEGTPLSLKYNVYSGYYGLSGKESTDEDGNIKIESWEKGGNIYIFAKAYQDQYFRVSGQGTKPKANEIEIRNDYRGQGKLNIYLVRGYYYDIDANNKVTNQWGLNFNKVIVDGRGYSSVPESTVLSGETSTENTYFHTNIKGMITDLALQNGDFEQTIGKEKPSMRCYEVTIKLTEQETGRTAADISTTKETK